MTLGENEGSDSKATLTSTADSQNLITSLKYLTCFLVGFLAAEVVDLFYHPVKLIIFWIIVLVAIGNVGFLAINTNRERRRD